MKYQTVASVTKLYKDTGRIEKIAKRKQKPMKINADGKDYIKNLISDDPSITLASIKMRLFQDLKLAVFVSTVYRAIDAFNYSLKRIEL